MADAGVNALIGLQDSVEGKLRKAIEPRIEAALGTGADDDGKWPPA